MNTAAHFSSESVEHATPQDFFNDLNQEFGFVLDVAATPANAKCDNYYTADTNGLFRDWAGTARKLGGAVWMNCPYRKPEQPCKGTCTKKRCRPHRADCKADCRKHRGHCIDVYIPGIGDWVEKAAAESMKGATVVALLPARPDTDWWGRWIWDHKRHRTWPGVELRFVAGRLRFGNAPAGAPFPSAVVIFRPLTPAAQ